MCLLVQAGSRFIEAVVPVLVASPGGPLPTGCSLPGWRPSPPNAPPPKREKASEGNPFSENGWIEGRKRWIDKKKLMACSSCF